MVLIVVSPNIMNTYPEAAWDNCSLSNVAHSCHIQHQILLLFEALPGKGLQAHCPGLSQITSGCAFLTFSSLCETRTAQAATSPAALFASDWLLLPRNHNQAFSHLGYVCAVLSSAKLKCSRPVLQVWCPEMLVCRNLALAAAPWSQQVVAAPCHQAPIKSVFHINPGTKSVPGVMAFLHLSRSLAYIFYLHLYTMSSIMFAQWGVS